MVLISIVDRDIQYREKLISKCKNTIQNLPMSFATFDSLQDLLKKSESVKTSDIVMISTEWIRGTYPILLDVLAKIVQQTKLHILFYGEDIHDILWIYNIEHFYYFLKHQMNVKLPNALKKGLRLVESDHKNKLVIKFKHSIDVVDVHEILYVSRQHRVLLIHTCNHVYSTYMSFDEILNSIPKDTLIQVNYSCLIQPKWVNSYSNSFVSMLDSSSFKITDRHRKKVFKVLSDLQKAYVKE